MDGKSSQKRKQVKSEYSPLKKPRNEAESSPPEEYLKQTDERMEDSEEENKGQEIVARQTSEYGNPSLERIHGVTVMGKHDKSVTALVLASKESYFIASSKDGNIIKWNYENYKKLATVKHSKDPEKPGYDTSVLSLALSDDDKYLASGDSRNLIKIWNPEDLTLLQTFPHSPVPKGEKSGITGLLFRNSTHDLISSSRVKTLKMWNLDERKGEVARCILPFEAWDLSSYADQSILTSSGPEGIIRIWNPEVKKPKEFEVKGKCIDCLAMFDPSRILFTTMEGCLVLWNMEMLKITSEVKARDDIEDYPDFISALCISKSKIIVTGSNDGYIRLWKIVDEKIMAVSKIPVPGTINALNFSADETYLLAASGQENRNGSWLRMKDVKNEIYKISMCV